MHSFVRTYRPTYSLLVPIDALTYSTTFPLYNLLKLLTFPILLNPEQLLRIFIWKPNFYTFATNHVTQ